MITATDKRTPSPGFSTGTPTQAESADTVMVQPTTTYMEGSKIVGPETPPYPASRHHAEELKTHGFAAYTEIERLPVDPPLDPPLDLPLDPASEPEIEQPDDQTRAPGQDQVTASTVPARPGAEPQRPAPGPVPSAATSDAPRPVRRRGRQAARKG